MIPGLTKNAVVAASAGTGKTQLLTSIYLAHCLGLHDTGIPLPPSRIVATTFSRAAAREIRERLEQRCAAVASDDAAEQEAKLGPLLWQLAQQRGVDARELRRRAALALEELPDAAIDTLHNLCARILREHGLELGLTPAFSILEEQHALDEAEQTIDEVLSHALEGAGSQALGATQLLDAAGGLERLRGWLLALLSRLDDEGLEATDLERADEGAAALRAAAELEQVCLELESDPKSPRAPLAARTRRALAEFRAGGDASELSDAFAELAGEAKGRSAAGAAALKTLLSRTRGRNNPERARALVRLFVEGPELAARLSACAELIAEIQRRLRERHVAEGHLGFGDLLRLTRDGLRERPELARRAGERIDLLLVDEFQDTSRVQCELLLLLRERPERSRARAPGALPRASDLRPRGLVVVGDRKQSIYGFRGADVSVFAELASSLAGERAAALLDVPGYAPSPEEAEAVAEVSTLVHSYRSDRAIVSAVNLIAERDFVPQLERSFEIRYAPAEALQVPSGRSNVSEGAFTLVLDDGRTPDVEPLVARATGALRSAMALAAFCSRAASAGRPLRSLAILARRRATLPLLGFALDHLGVPYVVSGRDLYGTQEVRDVLSALRLSQAPRDRHALAVLARSPLGGLSDQALVELSDEQRGLLPVELWQPERLTRPEDSELASVLRQRLLEFQQVAPRLSPRDAIHDVVERFRLAALFSRLPRGAVRLANLGRLQEIAASHGGNLAAFVRFVQRQIASELDETEAALFSPDDDAVRLLTIHGSKGLAFPSVLLADADAAEMPAYAPVGILRQSGARPRLVLRYAGEDGPIVTESQAEWAEDAKARAQAERQRLSYVALTRAEHELVIALPSQPRAGTLARTLAGLQAEGVFATLPGYRELNVSELLATPRLSKDVPELGSAPPPRPRELPAGAVVLGATALAGFQICPRRFDLLELLGVPEPRRGQRSRDAEALEVEPRLAGIAAHRVLETFPLPRWGTEPDPAELRLALEQAGLPPDSATGRQTLAGLAQFLGGAYAQRVAREAVRVERELSLSVALPAVATPKTGGTQLPLFGSASTLVVKATLDLLVELADGSLHVIDYKRTRGGERDEARYRPQLSLYHAVVAQAFGRAPRVGLLHLLGDASEPEWLEPSDVDGPALAKAFLAARASDVWPHAPQATCRSVQCGFLSSCYGPREG